MTPRQRIQAVLRAALPDAMGWYGDLNFIKRISDLIEEYGRY